MNYSRACTANALALGLVMSSLAFFSSYQASFGVFQLLAFLNRKQ